jgi:hypothetical protein
MKYTKIAFFLIISLITLNNAKVIAMQVVPLYTPSLSSKTTSFSAIVQFLSNYISPSKEIIYKEIKDTTNDLMQKIKDLETALTQDSNRNSTENINLIENTWYKLTHLYVSNDFEKFFNLHGPNIDELKPTIKALRTKTHPDKKQGPLKDTFDNLSKMFNIERREDPLLLLKDPNTIENIANNFATALANYRDKIIEDNEDNLSLQENKAVIEIKNSQALMNCYSYIKRNKDLQHPYQTGKLNKHEN